MGFSIWAGVFCQIFATLLPLVAFAADTTCRQLEAGSDFYVEGSGQKIGGALWQASDPSPELRLPQIMHYACDRLDGQFQGLGWGTVPACKGLLDPRKIDASGDAYFNGPNDPSRCMATVHLKGFKQKIRSFLDGDGFVDDGGGHTFSRHEIRSLYTTLNRRGGCKAGPSYADRFQCVFKAFDGLSQSILTAQKKLGTKPPKQKEFCAAMDTAGMTPLDLELVLEVSQNRHRPDNLNAKDFPAYIDCRSEALPHFASVCAAAKKSSVLAAEIPEKAWRCINKGIHRIAELSQFKPPIGYVNPLRERLDELRRLAADASLFSRLCVANFKNQSLTDPQFDLGPSDHRKERTDRCLSSDYEAFRNEPDYLAWLKQLEQKEMKEAADAQAASQAKSDSNSSRECKPVLSGGLPNGSQVITLAQQCLSAASIVTASDAQIKPNDKPITVMGKNSNSGSDFEIDSTILALVNGTEPKEQHVDEAATTQSVSAAPAPISLPPEFAALAKKMEIPVPVALAKSVSGEHYRTPAELVSAAQDELRAFKEKKESRFEFGQFFLETEANDIKPNWSEERYQSLLAKYRGKKAEYEEFTKNLTGDFRERVRALMIRINQDFLKDYTAGNALLSDFFDGHGGNCEAETKFTDTVLRDLGIHPENGWVFGAQVFDDHVQPVLFNAKTRHVIDLHTMDEYDGLIAPIYETDIMVSGYLKAQGAKSPVTDADLLIAGFNAQELRWAKARGGAGKAGKTDTNISLPKTGVVFSEDKAPEHSAIVIGAANASVKQAKDFKPAKPLPPLRLPMDPLLENGEKPISLSLEDVADPRPGVSSASIGMIKDFTSYFDRDPALRVEAIGRDTLVFRTRRDETRYLNARKQGDRTRALEDMVEEEWVKEIHSIECEDAKLLFSDPFRVMREVWSEDRITIAKNCLVHIEDFLSGYKGSLNVSGNGYINFPSSDEAQSWHKRFLRDHPEVEEILRIRDARAVYLESHVEDGLRLIPLVAANSILNKALMFGAYDEATIRKVNRILGVAKYKVSFAIPLDCEQTADEIVDPSKIGFLSHYRAPAEIKPTLSQRNIDERKKRKSEESLRVQSAQDELELVGINKSISDAERAKQRVLSDSTITHIGSTDEGIDEKPKELAPQEKMPGKGKTGSDHAVRDAGARVAKGDQDFTQIGNGTQATGSGAKPEPDAKIKLPSIQFAMALHNSIDRKCQNNDKKCSTAKDAILSRWTPGFSRALLGDIAKNKTISDTNWFLSQGYSEISSRRDPKTLTLPGPAGPTDKIPVDLALLWLAITPDLSRLETYRGIEASIKQEYGSLDGYKAKLREALKKELTGQ